MMAAIEVSRITSLLDDVERERLERHFETQLKQLGVPLRPDVWLTLVSDEEWPNSGPRSVLAGFVSVIRLPILEFPEGLPTVGGCFGKSANQYSPDWL
jgi:hypothetical protein